MQNKIFAKLTNWILILSLANAVAITPYLGPQANPICPVTGTLSYTATDLLASPATTLDYDFTTTYLTTESDSAPLMVKKETVPMDSCSFLQPMTCSKDSTNVNVLEPRMRSW